MDTIRLRQPFKVNGKDMSELKLDFDSITPEGFIRAEALSNAKRSNQGASASLAEVDYGFHLYLAFEAAVCADPSVDIADLERITGRDLVQLMQAGRFFALGADGDSTESGSDEPSASTPTNSAPARTK